MASQRVGTIARPEVDACGSAPATAQNVERVPVPTTDECLDAPARRSGTERASIQPDARQHSIEGGNHSVDSNTNIATDTWLGFELAGQSYAVPLARVQEIIRPEPETPVPGAPTDVAGIINLRGNIVTVLDGRRRLGLDAGGATEAPGQRLVIFRNTSGDVGMRIDVLRDVLELDTRDMLPPLPGGTARRSNDPVVGTLYVEDRFIALLDPSRLCDAGDGAAQ